MRRVAATLAALFLLPSPAPWAAPVRPRLVVFLTVDQFRGDYVERYGGQWTAGLRRLFEQGAYFSRAAYPYLNTVTCAGHATIATGTFPNVHGIMQNTWFDRATRLLVTCTEDNMVESLPARERGGGESAARLLVPTFAEEMKRQKGSRFLGVTLKPRISIMMAGRNADAIAWLSESLDHWETSTAFAAAPPPELQAYAASHPISADFKKRWTRMLPTPSYAGDDSGL